MRSHPFVTPLTADAPEHRSTCLKSSLAKDVAVVLRTGATESQKKVPIHFETVMSCVSDLIIYSDFNETIEGHQVYDVLANVSDTIKDTVPEFNLYNHLRSRQREGLVYKTLYGSGPQGALENRGWKLDKWKFLPMVDRVLRDRPRAKWFVFIEADTYMLWQNMLRYLARFDAAQPHYLGKHMYINDVFFGHGGSGFVLSRPAAEMVSARWRAHTAEYDEYTQTEWAGDAILGKALRDAGVDMFSSFPHLQGDSLTTVDWNVSKLGREPWCYAPTTFHHMNRSEFRELWTFEQAWLSEYGSQGPAPRFRDVFRSLVLPKLKPGIDDWDNLSTGMDFREMVLGSSQHCRAACESIPTCLQFSYNKGACFISSQLKLGHPVESGCLEYSNAEGKCITRRGEDDTTSQGAGVSSGWIMSRVAAYVNDLDRSCEDKDGSDWIVQS